MMLGNLTVDQMEQRAGVTFPQELKNFMNSCHQPLAEGVKKGQWHCFDIPFILLCGDMDTAQTIYDHLKNQSKDFKQKLQISINS
jgi:hypothetical protein